MNATPLTYSSSTAIILYNPAFDVSTKIHRLVGSEKVGTQKIQDLFEEKSFKTSDVDSKDRIDFSFCALQPSTNDYESLYLRSPNFCFDSPILVPKKQSDELYTRELFSLDKAIEQNGDLIKYRSTENNFDIYIFDEKSYLVWNQGPQKGHIYRVLKKNKTRSFQPPSQEEFRKYLDELIQNPNSQECKKYLEKCVCDLFESKHGDYHLWEAQYFIFPGQDESIIDLFTEIHNLGFRNWMKIQCGINYSRILNLIPEVYEELVSNKKLPKIFLTHGTFSDKLPSVIQLGGLASSFHAVTLGINKTRGGEEGGTDSCSPCLVSFWEYPQGNGTICPGFGVREGFEYPITFAVGESHYKDRNSYHSLGLARGSDGPLRGEMRGEAVVKLFWPIECIDYIFVPPFAVEDVSKLLQEHGLTHIEVFPSTRAPKSAGE